MTLFKFGPSVLLAHALVFELWFSLHTMKTPPQKFDVQQVCKRYSVNQKLDYVCRVSICNNTTTAMARLTL
ncbi:hypothetical protein BSR59_25135 [Vibrio parahaemolyticus]|nr:hypothetical protein Vp2S01_A0757 [Vibrio parahaemolyticus]KFE94929.1 hypothetical protein HB39_12190 [Vibrio parahaemolyticus]OOQ62400.1 hypothetical protein BSR59_25135 [Vibrio parahaemolyticus]OOQ72284.1 hypothetical protein BSR63_24035 [Vibrio parahaemolyticus]